MIGLARKLDSPDGRGNRLPIRIGLPNSGA